jgi:long-chain acyl-CoA synthetase
MSLNLATISCEGARRFSDKAALIEGDSITTFADLDERARRLAGVLRDAGVQRGQHVALMLPNTPEFAVAYFACHYLGAPVVPLNILLVADEVTYHLDDSEAVAFIVHPTLLERARPGYESAAHCGRLFVVDEVLRQTATPVDEVPDTMPDDTAVILYTSGTTGRPKGAELTHFNMFYNAELASRRHGTDEHTVALAVLPLFHSFGQTVIQNGTLMRGGTVVLMPRFEPQAAFEAMKRHSVSFFAGVPTMYFALLHHPEAKRYDLASLRECACGGAPMPIEVMREFIDRYDANIIEGYGLSETSPVASLNPVKLSNKSGSVGTPIWGVSFQLIDAEGHVIEDSDTPGEICIKGHNVMKGYFRRPEATREAIRDGWFRTGDIAMRDDDGYYFIVDRKKDMILRGGFNVYPREVEEVLYAHDAVAEAAVVGIRDERLGEEVKAVVALKPGKTADAGQLIAFCKERVAAYKYPRFVEIVDALPKGPTGKILKRALREG